MVNKKNSRLNFATKIIKDHSLVKKYLTLLCYVLISCSFLVYCFYAIIKTSQHYKLKIINNYGKDPKDFNVEKTMTNPRIKFQYSDNKIYNIKAEKAIHKNDSEITLFDVYAEGEIGNISAGKLDIKQEGDHLIFSEAPKLILKKGDL